MQTVWEILYARKMALHYAAPPICEVIFSGSSSPIIVLSEPQIGKVTGLVLSGSGVFRLSWNAFPGAICYNVYFIGGDNVAVPLAQCVTDPFFDIPPGIGPGELIVTPIPLEGEGPPSDPVVLPGGGGTAYNVSVTSCPQASVDNFPAAFTISRNGTSGNLLVNFTLSGTAVNGLDYTLVSTFATIPNGFSSVEVDIAVVEAAMLVNKTVTLTLNTSLTYFVASPTSATMLLRPAFYKITGYGGVEPFFAVPQSPPEPFASEPSDACEWDGSFNRLVIPGSGNRTYFYQDVNGKYQFPIPIGAINGFQMSYVSILGPPPAVSGNWFIVINFNSTAGVAQISWFGQTPVGRLDAPGIFTRISGADLRATVTLEAVP